MLYTVSRLMSSWERRGRLSLRHHKDRYSLPINDGLCDPEIP
jgi:hypothetical protein